MGLFRHSPEQKMERMLDRLDKAAHHYEKWVYPFDAFHSERDKDKELDRVLDLLVEAIEFSKAHPELRAEPADVLSFNMEKWLVWRAEEKGLKIALNNEGDR